MKTTLSALLLALALAGCKPQQPQDVPPPPATDAPAAAPAAPAETAPTTAPDPTTTPAAPAQPAPDAPAPTDPSPAPKPTAANVPVESMKMARPSAKMSVAADLRYSFDGSPTPGQPVTLHVAAIPRVDGTHLNVEIKPAAGLEISKETLSEQKVLAKGVYRQQYSLTRTGPVSTVRVLVTMDMPEGTAFGFFTIPLDAGTIAQKSDSVKQH
ncbi:MAG TPA: hypothetical protein VMF52_21225 [Steroidobacteraceae bacterium]|nr:hypothetical protein [Steroidobacteraceae bacterium]